MNKLKVVFCSMIFMGLIMISQTAYSQTIIELDGVQSMSITGKGPGQDAAINPFKGQDTYVLIKNISGGPFEARVKSIGKLVNTIKVLSDSEIRLKLLKGEELYFDSDEKATVSVKFEKVE